MPEITYIFQSKRPAWATPEALLELKQQGKTLKQIGDVANISPERVRQLIKKAKPDLTRAYQFAQESQNSKDSLH